MDRPFSTAFTMEVKLSSVKILRYWWGSGPGGMFPQLMLYYDIVLVARVKGADGSGTSRQSRQGQAVNAFWINALDSEHVPTPSLNSNPKP